MAYVLLLTLMSFLIPVFSSDDDDENDVVANDPQETDPTEELPRTVGDPDPQAPDSEVVTPEPVSEYILPDREEAPEVDFGAADTLAATSGDDFIRVGQSGSQFADGDEGDCRYVPHSYQLI